MPPDPDPDPDPDPTPEASADAGPAGPTIGSPEAPRGLIARVEKQKAHQKFVRAAEPATICLKIFHCRRLRRAGLTLEEYFTPDVTTMTTTTIRDEVLDFIPWVHERNHVLDLEPDFHVPTDHSDYVDLPLRERVRRIEKSMKGAAWMRQELRDHGADTTVVPLVKGATRREREVCYSFFDEAGIDTAAIYAVPYFTAGDGLRIQELVADIEEVAEERPDLDLVILGLMSPGIVSDLPDNVVAVAGKRRWRRQTRPRENDPAEIRTRYRLLEAEVLDALPGVDVDPDRAAWRGDITAAAE